MNDKPSDKTITEGSRALECFTDRTEAVHRFCEYLNEEHAPGTFLFFHGVGGNGKSLLLRFLQKRCCRLIPARKSLKGLEYSSLLLADPDESGEPLPCVLLDFGRQPNGEDRPQEVFQALLMLRRGLSGYKLGFPLYDFACTWYLYKTKRLSPERLSSLFPAEECAVLSAIADAISKTAYGALGSTVLSLLAKRFDGPLALYWQKRKLSLQDVEHIQGLDAESELIDELPTYFAADLNVSMEVSTAPKRVVLFFDTHEAFWGQDRSLSNDQFYRRDEWFRRLLGALHPEKGIVVVAAGQDRPRWSEAKKHAIPDSKVEYRLIGNLSEENAQAYLVRAGIRDAAMRRIVCTYSEVEPGQIHPLFLGLCADVILEAAERKIELAPDELAKYSEGPSPGAALVDRFLRYVDEGTGDAVRAISACRAFDRDIYFELADKLRFNGTDHAFRKLVSFSFVSRIAGSGEGVFGIHELLRRLLHESGEDLERKAHHALEARYRRLTGPAATAEAIYHAARLDWKRGVREWVKLFDSALWSSDYPLCRALLAVRGALGVKGHLESGMLARCEADFFRVRALYAESNHEYLEALKCFDLAQGEDHIIELQKNRAKLFLGYGELQSTLSQLSEAAESYQKVIEICEVHERAPGSANDEIELCNFKAEAHLGLGDLNHWASESAPATESYSAAIAVCDRVLQQLQSYPVGEPLSATIVDVWNNKAYGLGGIGDVETSLFHHAEAILYYQQALSCYDEALQWVVADPVVQNDKAYTFVSIAESEAALSRHVMAVENCKHAVALYDEILQRAPEDLIYHSNRSRALRTAGISLGRLSRYDEALQRYSQALAACSEALRQAPTDTWALCNKGLILLSLGEVHAETGKNSEALESFRQSLDTFESFLAQSPDDNEALAGKARVLFNLGEALSVNDGENSTPESDAGDS